MASQGHVCCVWDISNIVEGMSAHTREALCGVTTFPFEKYGDVHLKTSAGASLKTWFVSNLTHRLL